VKVATENPPSHRSSLGVGAQTAAFVAFDVFREDMKELARKAHKSRRTVVGTLRDGAERKELVVTAEMAERAQDMAILMLMVCLPPHRSRLFRSLELRGANGVRDPPHACDSCGASRPRCEGNTLRRIRARVYELTISHHKNESRGGELAFHLALGLVLSSRGCV